MHASHLPELQFPFPLRILSHNIRYATSSPFPNEKPWPERFPLIMNELSYNTRLYSGNIDKESTSQKLQPSSGAFICLQEVLHDQLLDILHGLNNLPPPNHPQDILPTGPLWSHIGIARGDGHTQGEYNPIIYPTQHYQLLHFETQWLSPTPDRPSKGWDAGSERILTVGVFEHKLTKQKLLACCTHLDNVGSESRRRSVDVILSTIKRVRGEWAASDDMSFIGSSENAGAADPQKQDLGVFLAGDFNSFPDGEAYLAMRNNDLMCDLQDYIEPHNQYGDSSTFTGFGVDQSGDEKGRIDFIWLGPKDGVFSRWKDLCESGDEGGGEVGERRRWGVEGYAVLANVFEDGVYSSDHRAVVGDVVLYK